MTTGIIAKAYMLCNLMGEQMVAQISQMQAIQAFSNIESKFAHDSVEKGDEMSKIVRVMDWIQILTIIVIPLTLGAGFAVAGMGGAIETAVSLSSAGAQITLGSATAGMQGSKSGLDAQTAKNTSGVKAENRNIETNSGSLKHGSETQIKIGGDTAQMIVNEGRIASQKIIGR